MPVYHHQVFTVKSVARKADTANGGSISWIEYLVVRRLKPITGKKRFREFCMDYYSGKTRPKYSLAFIFGEEGYEQTLLALPHSANGRHSLCFSDIKLGRLTKPEIDQMLVETPL